MYKVVKFVKRELGLRVVGQHLEFHFISESRSLWIPPEYWVCICFNLVVSLNFMPQRNLKVEI